MCETKEHRTFVFNFRRIYSNRMVSRNSKWKMLFQYVQEIELFVLCAHFLGEMKLKRRLKVFRFQTQVDSIRVKH